ncbi:HEPN domain-containing protein [Thermococcus camini]|uniref:Putative Nucleotide-binding protein n=1 Tax=Thermococcus camini TaxID=2016373 RepID=A0A7G2D951_9EURY|nr:HEPN domain-containing protein [Thermococcus camini]CAD5244755.1 putative Nucleotide-binding protein [Thermococcus camini]
MHYEEVETLLRRSEDYLELANEAFEREKYDTAVFLVEQALQLYLKAVIIKYSDVRLRTHSIRELLKGVGDALEAEDEIAEFIRQNRGPLRELEDAYTKARYEPRIYYREDAQDLMEFALKVRDFVEGLVDAFERRIEE